MPAQARQPHRTPAGARAGRVSAGPHASRGGPRYHRIADQLRARIQDGDFVPGQRLPSEAELIDAYAVSRNTVRLAVRRLIDEGLVTAGQGRGTFVRSRPPRLDWDLTATGQQWAERVAAAGHQLHQDVTVSTAAAPPAIAVRLGADPAGPVCCWRRAVAVDGEPHLLAVDYLPGEPGRPGDDVDAALAARGVTVSRWRHELATRMPTRVEIDALRLPPGTPVVEQTRIGYAGDRPVQVTVTILPGDRHRITIDVPAGPADAGPDGGEARHAARHEGGRPCPLVS